MTHHHYSAMSQQVKQSSPVRVSAKFWLRDPEDQLSSHGEMWEIIERPDGDTAERDRSGDSTSTK